MIPIKDDNPRIAFPIVTIVLILANVGIFLYQMVWAAQPEAVLYRFGTIPWEITHFQELGRLPLAFQTSFPNVITLITSMFLHGGILHLLGNMLYLWIFGDNVEGLMGPFRFLVFYILCGLVATLGHVLMTPNSIIPMVGASGAISGVLGAYVLRFPRARVHVVVILIIIIRVFRVPAWVILGFWFVMQLFNGLLSMEQGANSGVAWFAHIGGFVIGMLLVFFFEKKERVRIYRGARWTK
jgi:membrane associated rhomboid family serine protease